MTAVNMAIANKIKRVTDMPDILYDLPMFPIRSLRASVVSVEFAHFHRMEGKHVACQKLAKQDTIAPVCVRVSGETQSRRKRLRGRNSLHV